MSKKSWLAIGLVIAAVSVLAIFSFASAFSLTDYQGALASAKNTYQSSLAIIQNDYNTAIRKANDDQTSAFQAASNALQAGSINSAEFEIRIAKIENDYSKALDAAQENFNAARKKALQDYQAGRSGAWQQYIGGKTLPTGALSGSSVVSRSDLKSVCVSAIINYFLGPASSKLTSVQLKDLLNVYLSSSGSSVNLSGRGASGQKLIDIYNKAKSASGSDFGSTYTYSGPLGSKTNPIKLNQPCPNCPAGGYTFAGGTENDGQYTMPANAKIYFEVDPNGYLAKSYPYQLFNMTVKGYNNENLKFYYLVRDRITGNELRGETNIPQNYSLGFNVFDNQPYKIDNVKYIFAVENLGAAAGINVWWSW